MLEKTDLVFQVFQLTALIMRGPVTCGGRFIINLDRVMICENEVQSAILCVQDFVRSPHFTQRNFFSDSGNAMLAESAAISEKFTHSAVFERHGATWRVHLVLRWWLTCVGVWMRFLIGGGWLKTHRSNGMRWVASSNHRKIWHPDPMWGFQISWKRGKLSTFPYVCPLSFLLVPVIYVFLLGSQKKRPISRSPVKRRFEIASPLQLLSNIVLLRIWVLVPLWTTSNPANSHGVVRESEEPLLCSRVDCHNWYVVSNFGRCSVPFIAVIDCHQHCETVGPLLIVYWYLCSWLVQSK